MHRAQLPILNPCSEDYAAMDGPAQRRFCDRCDKHVHDLSAMTEPEAKALLDGRAPGQRLCVRYRCGTDGRIAFRPTVLEAAFVALASLAVAACTSYAEPEALESPDTATLCRDASGFAIDCALADAAVIPDGTPEPEIEPGGTQVPDTESVAEPVVEPPSQTEEIVLMGDIAEPLEPCPLPQRGTEPGPAAEHLVMGELPELTGRERRTTRREHRRTARRRRRL